MRYIRLLLISVFFLSLFACNPVEKIEIKQDTPGEYMYNQRAYPDNIINKKAITRAILQTREAISKKDINTTSWELKGPVNVGGRVTDIAISPDDDDIIYISTAVGGVFKTTNRGTDWNPVFDNIGRPSIGNIEIAPSDSQRIYVGTGEANGSATSGAFFGDGMYRSDDAGETWSHIGLDETQHIARIVVDPNDKNRVFAATTGTLYGKNEERGLYRTFNGGNSWEKVLYVSDSTAVIDVVMNPQNTNVLFAATWERIRYPWVRDYGGVTSGIHRSLDGGNTWVKLTNGLPVSDSETGRIGLAISESNPSTIYATYTTNSITNIFAGLYKSTDNGDSWTLVASDAISDVNSSFGWYFGNLRIHPTDPNEVYIMGQLLYKTVNSGMSWSQINGMHVDFHSMEYSKTNPSMLVVGCDGGAYISEDSGNSWTHFNNLPITQFYNIEVDEQNPNRLYGGTQDNNTIRTTTGSNDDWYSIWGGDGFQVNVDKNDGNYVYAESQWGNLGRSTNGGDSMSWATEGIDYNDRKNWNTPVEISPFDTNVLYYGSNKLYISTNRAVSWSVISDDLTGGLHPSGSTAYGTLTCIAPSYNNLNVIYTGSDDGHVSVTFDGGLSWNAVDADLPDRFVSQIAIHPNDDDTAYVTFSGFSLLDYTPHIYKTVDGGQNWVDISGNLPDIPINDVIVTPENNYLYVATDSNVWYSMNQGETWNVLGVNMPIGIIADIRVHQPTNTMYAGTFGRSLYSFSLDDITTSVNDISSDDLLLSLYPNPTKGRIKVQLQNQLQEKGEILITDSFGNIVIKTSNKLLGKDLPYVEFDLSDLAKGIYFVHIRTASKSFSKKIIIE